MGLAIHPNQTILTIELNSIHFLIMSIQIDSVTKSTPSYAFEAFVPFQNQNGWVRRGRYKR